MERINTLTDTRTQTYPVQIGSLAIGSKSQVAINNQVYQLQSINLATGVPGNNFITDATIITSLYGIRFNSLDDHLFVADATDYTNDGKVFSFDVNGKKIIEFNTGTAPKATVFNYSYK